MLFTLATAEIGRHFSDRINSIWFPGQNPSCARPTRRHVIPPLAIFEGRFVTASDDNLMDLQVFVFHEKIRECIYSREEIGLANNKDKSRHVPNSMLGYSPSTGYVFIYDWRNSIQYFDGILRLDLLEETMHEYSTCLLALGISFRTHFWARR